MKKLSSLAKTKGTVTKILLESHMHQIISIKTKSKSIRAVITNPYQYVECNDHISISGVIEYHKKYGEQLITIDVDISPVTNDMLVDFLSVGIGVGKTLAKRLITTFPNDLIIRLESNDISSLTKINRISPSLATIICNNFNRVGGKLKLLKWLDTILPFTSANEKNRLKSIAKMAYSHYGESTVNKLIEDPYRIWSFSSFNDAELLASHLKISKSDKRRLICAVEEVMFNALKRGNTQVLPLEFQDELACLVGNELVISAIFESIHSASEKHPRFVVTEPKHPINIDERSRLYNKRFALPSAVKMENYVKYQLLERIQSNILQINISSTELDGYVLTNNHRLSKQQKEAVRMVLANAVSAISGGAGTGKTSVLQCITDFVKQSGNHTLQVALSGKAAQRISQQTRKAATTIESLLVKINKDKNYLNQFPVPLLLIDEASMVDLQSMTRLLKAFEGRPARLIFVGDWAQLPPVGVGLIYHRVMQSSILKKIVLTENFRSSPFITDVAESVKRGEFFEENEQVKIIQCISSKELVSTAHRQYELHLQSGSLHIITAKKLTVTAINVALHNTLTAYRKVIKSAPQFKVGDKVIYKRNQLETLGIANGSTGVVTGGDEQQILVNFDREGDIQIPVDYISDTNTGEYLLQLSYAMTCHSAQGSEFDTVIIVIEDITLVERSWLYTAITRAKRKVILITAYGAIANALNRGFRFENINVGFELC
ncbi:AAA family ATPase [Colwellia psychrerythraea]|uniref:Uncharacterized protein n=1 Tax=Colwellia psychrerythraea TaxID=28229 RepID=A0A099KFV2_COLPS|nr:AAA family ATPase [Colwellia psychrerythraea]KGJ89614.1 hypothetical protein ND2E_3805 [Colwellia psychrerythraea]